MSEAESTRACKWPSVVEIEVNARCNLRCSYCPNSLGPARGVPNFMDVSVFRRVIHQLRRIDFSGRLSYHFYNEPLLRADLEDLICHARHALPKSYQLLYTNGDYLTDDRYAALLEAGIDHFLITRHGWTEIAPRAFQTVQFPDQLEISNRGGAFRTIDRPLRRPCFAPWEMLIVTVEGSVVLCHEDAGRTTTLGNLVTQNIEDVWFSPQMNRLRKTLAAGGRDAAAAICASCDHRAYPGANMAI